MTTPHKSMLIQARDALLSACGGRCNAEYNPCEAREVADALTAAIDAQEPEHGPVAWIGVHVFDALKAGKCVTSTMTKHKAFEDDVQIFTRPPAVREPLTDAELWANDQIMALNADLGLPMESLVLFARAIEAALRAKP